ncbi:MAG: ORF6N domain-containing protein, partial [Campylobacterales bacterium]|nr:ORF6N domain-containing protein [Campylobacterales bacterium]
MVNENVENNLVLTDNQNIQNKIYTIRDVQVMLDKDLALLYDVKPTRLREQVRRNDKKFPWDFMFELTENEVEFMVSQNAIPSKQHLGGSFPLVFTEQGVSMLATVLRSDIATEVSINIMRAFVKMRKFISSNANMFGRFERIEQRLSLHDENFNKIFSAIEEKGTPQKQHIFYDGQIFDAYLFVSDIIKSAQNSIKLIDNYVDESTLVLFTKRDVKVSMKIYTKTITKQLQLDLQKHNAQYPKIEIEKFELSHDRFLIIDDKEVYHFGASLKDLDKKWFAVSKMDIEIL